MWAPGSPVPDMFYPVKNSLAHLLHAPDRGDPKESCKRGFKKQRALASTESWAKSQLTAAGKVGSEIFNRPDVWLSVVAGSAEMLQAIEEGFGESSEEQFFGKGLADAFAPFFAQLDAKKTCEVLNAEDYPGSCFSKEDTEVAVKKMLVALGKLGSKWTALSDLMLLSHNLYVATYTLLSAVALTKHPNVVKGEFVNGKAMPAEPYNAWVSDPSSGPKLVKFLAAVHWQETSAKRHSTGAPRHEEEPEGTGGGLSWSPVAEPIRTTAAKDETPLQQALGKMQESIRVSRVAAQSCIDMPSISKRASADCELDRLEKEKATFKKFLDDTKRDSASTLKLHIVAIKKALSECAEVLALRTQIASLEIEGSPEDEDLNFDSPNATPTHSSSKAPEAKRARVTQSLAASAAEPRPSTAPTGFEADVADGKDVSLQRTAEDDCESDAVLKQVEAFEGRVLVALTKKKRRTLNALNVDGEQLMQLLKTARKEKRIPKPLAKQLLDRTIASMRKCE